MWIARKQQQKKTDQEENKQLIAFSVNYSLWIYFYGYSFILTNLIIICPFMKIAERVTAAPAKFLLYKVLDLFQMNKRQLSGL